MTRLQTGQNFRNGCGQNFRNWQKVLATWHDLASDTGRVLLATGRFVGEGFDDPLLDVAGSLSVGPDHLYLSVSQYESDIWVANLRW